MEQGKEIELHEVEYGTRAEPVLGIIIEDGRVDRVITNDAQLAKLLVLVLKPDNWTPGDGDLLELPEQLHHMGRAVAVRADTPDVRRDGAIEYILDRL